MGAFDPWHLAVLMNPNHRERATRGLGHKVLSIGGTGRAERASRALKVRQSEGQLTIASTGKKPGTGRLVSHEYRVRGAGGEPNSFICTSTTSTSNEGRCSSAKANGRRTGSCPSASGRYDGSKSTRRRFFRDCSPTPTTRPCSSRLKGVR